ncbi:MAG TPA: sensor histidine kinase, partial [Lysobacter sp.]
MSEADHIENPLDALWQAPALIWVLIGGEGLAAVLALAPGVEGSRWVLFGLASLAIQWVALFALGILYVARSALSRLRPLRIAYIALGLLLLGTWIIAGATWFLVRDAADLAHRDWQSYVLRLTALVLTVGLLGLAAFQNYWHARQSSQRARRSELLALQARIRPH